MKTTDKEFKLESVTEAKKLVLLDGSPAGTDGPASVAFSHEIYADLLSDVLLNNKAGGCVGFFARWGQGKSTVVNLLSHAVSGKARMVIFNAYQARGDSVRRQMLLSILREIDPEMANDYQRFSQTITPFELTSVEEQQRFKGRKLLKLLFLNQGFDWFLVVSAVVAISCTAIFAYNLWQVIMGNSTFADSHALVAWVGGMVVACVSFILRKLHERKTSLLAYTQPVSESQRLKYPEQFAAVFTESVCKYTKATGRRLIIVVDDLDRCDPATVVEALASVRQFCHSQPESQLDCQFLVPCDEGQMVSALEADGYMLTACHTRYHNYSDEEMLRKFFDFVVRMDEIVPESLADFAASEAEKIGLSPALARDVVDAAAIREPRKVKSLLNALRVAQETVARSHARDLLPDPNQLERFDYTLAMLVCFQELAPNAFAQVKANTDVLLQPELPSDKGIEQIAHRIFSSFGPVSATTADVLITKQNEPSLRGLPQAHSLSAAVRGDRAEEVVKILSDADQEQQNRLLNWLSIKLRYASSNVRVKQLTNYALDFGEANGWDAPSLRRFFDGLKSKTPHLREAFRVGSRLEILGQYCDTLPDLDRHFYYRLVLENYLETPESLIDEERFVLRYADKLPDGDAERLRSSLREGLFTAQGVNLGKLKQLAINAPQEKEVGICEFAPDIGQRLFEALADRRNLIGSDYHEPCLEIGLRLIGTSREAAKNIFASVIKPAQAFQTPQDLSEQYLKANGVYFALLRGLLACQVDFQDFETFFRSPYRPWLDAQAHPHGRLKILYYIQPGWGFLSEKAISQTAQVVAQWFWNDKEFAKEAVATIDTPVRTDNAWLKGRDELRRSIFSNFCSVANGQTSLSATAKQFLTNLQTAAWDVREPAEILLSEKVRHLNPNVSPRPSNIFEWLEALKPLCDPKFTKLTKTCRDALANNSSPQELIEFALQTVWIQAIPSDCAAPLAEALIRYPAPTLANAEFGKKLSSHAGFSEVARVLMNQLPSRGADWMHSNKQFMMALSEHVVTDGKLAAKFQETIDVLLTANRDDYFRTGLDLLFKHERIHPDVRRSLEAWCKGRADTDALAKQASEVSHRPEF